MPRECRPMLPSLEIAALALSSCTVLLAINVLMLTAIVVAAIAASAGILPPSRPTGFRSMPMSGKGSSWAGRPRQQVWARLADWPLEVCCSASLSCRTHLFCSRPPSCWEVSWQAPAFRGSWHTGAAAGRSKLRRNRIRSLRLDRLSEELGPSALTSRNSKWAKNRNVRRPRRHFVTCK